MFIEKRNFYNSTDTDSFFMLFISKERIGNIKKTSAMVDYNHNSICFSHNKSIFRGTVYRTLRHYHGQSILASEISSLGSSD